MPYRGQTPSGRLVAALPLFEGQATFLSPSRPPVLFRSLLLLGSTLKLRQNQVEVELELTRYHGRVGT